MKIAILDDNDRILSAMPFGETKMVRKIRRDGWDNTKPITKLDIAAACGVSVNAVGDDYHMQMQREDNHIVAAEYEQNPVGAIERAQARIAQLNDPNWVAPAENHQD